MQSQTTLSGAMLIGNADVVGTSTNFAAVNPATDLELVPRFTGGTASDVDRACLLAEAAFDAFRETPPNRRADLLDRIAVQIELLGDDLISRACEESGLPRERLEGERGRTTGQLRRFASALQSGRWNAIISDPADSDRQPPKPDLKLRHIGIGPIAIFGASNFPLAFSVAGGDTASALAAGCPVVFKGHPAHPGTSEMVGRAVRAAVQECGLPEGVFSLLVGADYALGSALVVHAAIKGVAFTGSYLAGTTLMRLAAARPIPIPVFAEMGSINPVLLLPAALESQAEALGQKFAGSLTLGAGQFCTNPGLLLGIEGGALDRFLASSRLAIEATAAAPMLTPGIARAFHQNVERLSQSSALSIWARSKNVGPPNFCAPTLFVTEARNYLNHSDLAEEVFGASAIIVKCADLEEMMEVAESLAGQLTATLHCEREDFATARPLIRILERKAGRLLLNGWPTGVEVSEAMVHGGPFPASSDNRSTSVGLLAVDRFLRPICYQGFPLDLLPFEAEAIS